MPGSRRQFAGQHLEERALAGAVGADDAAQLALLHCEIDVAIGDEPAERLAEAARLQHRPRERRLPGGAATARCWPAAAATAASGAAERGRAANRPARSRNPPIRPRRRKHTSSTKITPSTSFQAAPSPSDSLQEVAQKEPHRGPEERAEQGADTADRGLHDQLPGGIEGERVGRHEALQHAEQAAGKAGIGGGDDERCELVEADLVPDRARPQRIVADRGQDRPDRRAHDAQRHDDADEVARGQETVHRPAGIHLVGQRAKGEFRRRHAGEPVLAAGPGRERRELDKEEHLGDRDRDHREVDAGAPQGDRADRDPRQGRAQSADHQRPEHARHQIVGQQVRGDEAAGAVKRRLAERQQSCVAEQDVEADAE